MSLKRIVVVAALLMFASSAWAQGVRKLDISFHDGRVTLIAENVTLTEVLAEWSRKGGSRFVNAEQITPAPLLPTEFTDRPEAEVLRALLRDTPGYGAAMREVPADGASSVGTVFILATRPTPTSSSPGISAAPPPANRLTFENPPQPQAAPRMITGSPDDEIPPVRPIVGDEPPSLPQAASQPTPNGSLRVGPGGAVTSTIPGVIIPVQGVPPGSTGPGTTPPTTTGGRGRGGGGGVRR